MAWVRIHDGALSHPKLVGLIDWRNPFCLWVWGLSHVQMHLTDGVIVKAALPHPAAVRTAARLAASGLWRDDGACYVVHDYLEWNDPKDKVLAAREQTRKRLAAWRAKRDESDNGNGVTERVTNAARNAVTKRVTNSVRNAVTKRVTNAAHATPRHEGRS